MVKMLASCDWLDGSDKFSHFVFQERQLDKNGSYKGSRVFVPKNWVGNTYFHQYGDKQELQIQVNGPMENIDAVIDIGKLFSEASGSITDRNKRFLVFTEPSHIVGKMLEERNFDIRSHYGYVLGWHQALRNHPGFRYCNPTSAWVKPLNSTNKPFGITGIFSGKKLDGHGYDIRHEIIDRQKDIKIPSKVYNYTNEWLGKPIDYPLVDKTESMSHMYGFAIENGIETGYYTEKIIDCFLTKTIPLYYGSYDLGNFDMNGVVMIGDNWLDKVNQLTPEFYNERIEVINKNYELAKNYSCMIGSLARTIGQILLEPK